LEFSKALRSGELQFGGNADGVIFFDEVIHKDVIGGELVPRILVPSLEMEATRYLRPVDEAWRQRHPGMIGTGRPEFLVKYPATALAVAREKKRPLTHLFIMDTQHAVEANQPDNINRWQIVPAEENGIWCVFFV
jgi:hypothetical protein